jgi:hypothetical protein
MANKNKQESQLEAGDKVFIINRKLEIEEKKVHGVVFEEETIKYQLEEHQCGGTERTQIFKTKAQAEAEKQNFLDKLKYKVGDLIVFEYNEYSRKGKTIGRITELEFSNSPYKIRGAYNEYNNASDENILLKIKNEFIEDFGNLKELYEEFKEKEKEINQITGQIHKEHERLESELNTSIKKQYSVFNWNKDKPLFKDRFNYEREYYD